MRVRRSLVYVLAALLMFGLLAPARVSQTRAQGDSGRPAEVVVAGERYAFDRDVPVALDQLEARTDDEGRQIAVRPGEEPPAAVYLPPADASGAAARYLAERLTAPDTACPVEGLTGGTIQGQDATYVPVAPEPDLTTAGLVEVGATSDGRTIFAPSADQPFQELFATTAEGGLVRYVLSDTATGAPSNLGVDVTFAGQDFALVPGAGDAVLATDLVKVGCLTGFPVLASAPDAPFATVYLQVSGRLVAYESVGAPPATESPTAATATPGTPAATSGASPTAAPTQGIEPIESPVASPTEVLLPTEEPTSTPEPSPTATTASTATATMEPTPTPTATAAPSPTSEPTATNAPTATQASTAAAQPTVTLAPTTEATATSVSRPTPTPKPLQPQAVVPTLPPSAPPPAAATTETIRCAGDPGALDADGLPGRLPSNLQYGGSGYSYAATTPANETGELTRVGCVGPFDLYTAQGGNLYLGLQNAPQSFYRYDATSSFRVDFEVTSDPRVIRLEAQGDQPEVRYAADDPWVRSVYSSVSLILFVADAEAQQPDRILGFAVDGQVIGEYRLADSAEPAPDEVLDAAEALGIHAELTLGAGGPSYVLTSIWRPFGSTTNGWVTLYGPEGEAAPQQLVGIDPRRLDLLVFNRSE